MDTALRSGFTDLAAWLRASPTGIGLTRQFQLLICMTKLFCNLCWISRLRNVLERRFDFAMLGKTADLDARKRSLVLRTELVLRTNHRRGRCRDGGSSLCREV